MRSAELAALGIREVAEAIRAGTVSPIELVDACLARIRALDGDLRAWSHVAGSEALAMARERLAEVRAGTLRGPLHGVPVGVKDIFDVAGMPTTGGAKPFAHTRPGVDAPAVARLRAAGAIIVGKTVTTEFAYRDPAPTRNPWNQGHTPGGSSAGSAAARAGATVSKVELPPSFRAVHAAGLTVLEVEAAAYHAPWFGKHGDDYGPQMRSLVEAGLRHAAIAYVDANRARLAFREDVMPLLAAHDALLCPTAPAPAPSGLGSTGDGSLCAPWSNAGVPAISLPSGIAASGLPHAIQLVQAAGESARLLGVAAWCERVLAFSQAAIV